MTLKEQFLSLIAMAGMGIWIGASLTTYHRFLPSRKVWRWILLFTDLLFWGLQALIAFYVLLYVNQGTIRFYLFLAIAIGFSAYKGLLETAYYKFLNGVIRFFVGMARFLKKIVILFFVQPFLTLLKLCLALVKMIGRTLLGILLFTGIVIYTPFKWIGRLLNFFIPKSWTTKVIQFFTNVKNFFINIKTFFVRFLKKWR
jgi:spore cortex biosynthesis protein YabQ